MNKRIIIISILSVFLVSGCIKISSDDAVMDNSIDNEIKTEDVREADEDESLNQLVGGIDDDGKGDDEEVHEPDTLYSNTYSVEPDEFRTLGVIYWGDYKWTWYSENVLPGGGLNIPGRWSDGDFVRDENNYICLASSDLPKGTVIDTPWGTGCIYDTGCESGTIDVYVSW